MKLVPLEKIVKNIMKMKTHMYDITEYTTMPRASYWVDKMKTIKKIQSLPTIDPIQIIDEMIEENIKWGSIWEIARNSDKMEVLQELKSRLSLTQK